MTLSPGSKRLWILMASVTLGTALPVAAQDDPPWTLSAKTQEIMLYERPHKDTGLLEFKAVGTIAASPDVVRRVLDDVPAYPSFMPYVTEARIISQDAKSRVTYQRISPPLISDRDYTVRVKMETSSSPAGPCYCNRWQAANDLGPAPSKGVERVAVTEGYWQLEPIEGGRATRVTYFIFSDSSGSLPKSVVNRGSRTAIPRLFESLRKQSKLPKYQ